MSVERHTQYLDLLGIAQWVRREPAGSEPLQQRVAQTPASLPDSQPLPEAAPTPVPPTPRDVPVSPPAQLFEPSSPQVSAPPALDVSGMGLDALRAQVALCERCDLHKTRSQTVFGVGDTQAQWMIIGEAPGADEDRLGEPFVGRAGKLLNNMLLAVGLKREAVYIANILKCRPPNNRDPRAHETQRCQPYLRRQIELVQPRLILVVGRIAAHNLLETQTPVGKLRGHVHYYQDTQIPVIVTYHPAYLLRSPLDKRKAWQDLRLACQTAPLGA